MHVLDLTTLERQIHRRATTANRAWGWASAIQYLVGSARAAARARPGSTLVWLEDAMAWTCQDLEEAGAWACDLDLVGDPDPQVALAVAERWLVRLATLTVGDDEAISAVMEAKARASACLACLSEVVEKDVTAHTAAA